MTAFRHVGTATNQIMVYVTRDGQHNIIMLGDQAIVQLCSFQTVTLEGAVGGRIAASQNHAIRIEICMIGDDHLMVGMGSNNLPCPLCHSRTDTQLQRHKQVVFPVDVHEVIIVVHFAFFKGATEVIVLRILLIGEIFIPQHGISSVDRIVMVTHQRHKGHDTI